MRVQTPFSIKSEGRIYHVERDGERISSVSVIFPGVSVDEAPKIIPAVEAKTIPTISITDRYTLIAERDIRTWQAILATYQGLEIDFNHAEVSYNAETPEEESLISLKSFTIGKDHYPEIAAQDYSMFGRAFLAIKDSYEDIDKIAFYVEGYRHLKAGHCIDAYNQFYLFLEANFGLPFKTKDAVKALQGNRQFIDAVNEVISEKSWKTDRVKLTLKGFEGDTYDISAVTNSIVLLRGHLRHNTLSNPNRWNPNDQEKHRLDALFIAAVCQAIARPTFLKTFNEIYAKEFFDQAVENKHMLKVRVTITMKDMERVRDQQIDMNFPTRDESPELAKVVMQKALEAFDHNAAGADLYAIRAVVIPTGKELFRYDLGPSISR
ncbi:hypothetical protein [Paenirhodobacter ferrireducens]|uniref:hypothetical protein n=1 Tax=Paenirhodobacter ferrireducens TaxID=1215032 RepID=UPI000FE3D349|nr:hypothetical protein [Sinirhodobacter ferrireducens]